MSFARTAATCSTLIAMLALAGGASASHQNGQGSSRDFAVGTGLNQIGRVSFAAHGGPSPLDPVTGHFHAKGVFPVTGEFNLQGPVTCLFVFGNPFGPGDEAALFYPVRNPDENEPHGVFIFLQDNGNPADGDPPDQIGFIPLVGPVEQPPACPVFPPAEFADLTHGNITIHDGGF